MKFKLGKKPFVPDARDLTYRKYRGTAPVALPGRPQYFGHEQPLVASAMYLNDRLGTCAIAGPMHMEVAWAAAAGRTISFSDDEVLKGYIAVSGYEPGKPETDTGCCLRDVLNYWRNTGFTDTDGVVHKIGAFLLIDPKDTESLDEAMYLFGGVDAGWQIQEAMQDQFAAGQPFDFVPGSPVEGGHCMPALGWRADGRPLSTWGTVRPSTDAFRLNSCDEAWAIVSQDQLNSAGQSPEGFDYAQLSADLDALPGEPE